MKKITYLILITLFLASCKSTNKISTSQKDLDKKTSQLTTSLIETATEFLGTKYKFGGTTSKGMDCSGLVYITFQKHDIQLPRTSYDMSKIGKQIKEKDIQKGDLVFFKTNNKNVINHVGLVTEVKRDEIIFIHSSTQKGVILSSLNEKYYLETFSQANRVY